MTPSRVRAGSFRRETPTVSRPALPPEQDVAQPFVNDQLIVDERVFFDYDGWELRPTGMEQLEEVARRYTESGSSARDVW